MTSIEPAPAANPSPVARAFRTMGRVLTFRATADELRAVGTPELVLGLACAWLAGIGRHYDNDRIEGLQKLGIGSVLYVFVLGLFLFLIVKPLRPKNWSYMRLVTLIALTSPLAFLYAIPVQSLFPDPEFRTANSINAWFLGIVSVWRLALLGWFLARLAELPWFQRLVALFFPMTVIVAALTALNLDRVVFNFMRGLVDASPNDLAYEVLMIITMVSAYAFIPLLLLYIGAILASITRKAGDPHGEPHKNAAPTIP